MNSSQILDLLFGAIASHPDVVAALLAYGVLGLLNGLLEVRVDGSRVTRTISTVLDRVAPTTRRDARDTFKWPLFAASVLRGVADAVDPQDPPSGAAGGPSRAPAVTPTRALPGDRFTSGASLIALVCTALVLASKLAACTPSPRPDGRYRPSGTALVIDDVARILGIVAPVLKPLALAQIQSTDLDARRAAEFSLTAFEGAASAWLAARRTWDARGAAGYCDAYVATGAVNSGLVDVIRTLGRNGIGLNPELNDLVGASGLLADRLAYCDPAFDAGDPADADIDAQVRLRARSVGAELRAAVDATADAARARGHALRPLPAIAH